MFVKQCNGTVKEEINREVVAFGGCIYRKK